MRRGRRDRRGRWRGQARGEATTGEADEGEIVRPDGGRLKRRRVVPQSLRQRLFDMAMGLELEAQSSRRPGFLRESARALGLLGTITQLFAPVGCLHADGNERGAGVEFCDLDAADGVGDSCHAADGWLAPLLDRLYAWLVIVLETTSEDPVAAGSRWSEDAEEEEEASLFATALHVCEGILHRLRPPLCSPALFEAITSLAALPWAGHGAPQSAARAGDEWTRSFSPFLRSLALQLLALLPPSAQPTTRVRAFVLAMARCGSAVGEGGGGLQRQTKTS